jgi:hypothetical protein
MFVLKLITLPLAPFRAMFSGAMLAILLPPISLLLNGRFAEAIGALIMCITIVLWPVASIFALKVRSEARQARETARIHHRIVKEEWKELRHRR